MGGIVLRRSGWEEEVAPGAEVSPHDDGDFLLHLVEVLHFGGYKTRTAGPILTNESLY